METVVLEAVTSETVSALAEARPRDTVRVHSRRSSERTRRHICRRFQSLPAIERDMRDHAYEYWFVRAVDDGRIVGYTGGHVEPETNRFFISKIYLLASEAEAILPRVPWSPSMSDFAASAGSLPCISPSTRVTTWAFAHTRATDSLVSDASGTISAGFIMVTPWKCRNKNALPRPQRISTMTSMASGIASFVS